MKRTAILIQSSPDGKRHLCIDAEQSSTILAYIQSDSRHRKKFQHISSIILNGLRNNDLYDKEEPNEKCKGKGVYGMKFFKGQENDRLYCKQFSNADGNFFVVAAELFLKKKTQKLSNQQISILEQNSTLRI